jgi:hypothetical protein
MEKRNNTRVVFEVGALIKYKKKTIECKVVNLSLNGVLLKTREVIPEKAEIKVDILMEGTASKLVVNLKGTVVRIGATDIAVEFKSIDLDSFVHLRNIVAYNEGSEEKIMNEFYKKFKGDV